MVKFQMWDGTGFKQVTPFMAGDRAMVRKMVEETAAQVRGGEEDHAARLREGRLGARARRILRLPARGRGGGARFRAVAA